MTRPFTRRLRAATAFALASVLTASALAACSSDDKKGDSNTLTLLTTMAKGQVTGDLLAKLNDKFTQQTGIKIEVQQTNVDDLVNTYEASKLANKERDLVLHNLTQVTSDWLPQGQVVDVKKYMDQWNITDKILPDALEFWSSDKGVAAIPFSGFNWPFWYNTDLLKKAGVADVPKTVDDLVAASQKLRAAGIQPVAVGGNDWTAQNLFAFTVQQYMKHDEAGKLFHDGGFCKSPNAIKGMDLLGQLRDEGVFIDNVQGYTVDQMSTAYFTGKAAIMPSGSWAYTSPDAKAVQEATQLGGFPVVPGGVYTKPTAFRGHSNGIWISPNGEKKIKSVEKYIKFMYASENLQAWVTDAAMIMSVKPDLLGDAKSSEPLMGKGQSIKEPNVDFLEMPDSHLPTGMDYTPTLAAFLGAKGQKGAELCKAMDKLYQK